MITNMAPAMAAILAQATDAAGETASTVEVQSVWDFIQKGGLMMIPIGLCSLVALTIIVERFISLRRRTVIPAAFLPGLRTVLTEKPGDKAEAIAYCRTSASPVANVFAAGLKKLDRPEDVMERHITEAGEREVIKLGKYVRSLAVIASVTPLMGLLGTIFGMITAFQTVAASGEALGKTEMLAGGIYAAMITTAAGLTVAIPVLIAYHWISAKIDKLVADIDLMTVEFMDELAEGRLGAVAVEARPETTGDAPMPAVQVATT